MNQNTQSAADERLLKEHKTVCEISAQMPFSDDCLCCCVLGPELLFACDFVNCVLNWCERILNV